MVWGPIVGPRTDASTRPMTTREDKRITSGWLCYMTRETRVIDDRT